MLLKNMVELDEKGKKGDWCFMGSEKTGEDSYICLLWGDDTLKNLSILPIKPNTGNSACWTWNGNKEAPTLEPSILVHPNPDWSDGWHGFLRDGKLVDA